ncbi:hypothetical protein QJS10_CPA10g01017 [Acorus calamus]|uniref:Subtilisin-like protease SBT2.5 n=1 Tax=Acorus calamus TaxID=4465 RepID=A0AAV9E2P2_ACOCL|nr:hypothetical protein QJS10_CPA10g01017 [Acorus calamus]
MTTSPMATPSDVDNCNFIAMDLFDNNFSKAVTGEFLSGCDCLAKLNLSQISFLDGIHPFTWVALSSYVFIAANVILHAHDLPVQIKHLNELLPPIVPFLTSHHHSLRCFTQLLVYQVLCKLTPVLEFNNLEALPLEKKCFMDLRSYLMGNTECVRLRTSMEGFLDAFDPKTSASPYGIFTAQNEDVREDLRCSMANDVINIKNECLAVRDTRESLKDDAESLPVEFSNSISVDFQKKATLQKHENLTEYDGASFSVRGFNFPTLSDMEKEDELLSMVLHSRSTAIEKIRENRQQLILVASLLDRIPNLAGLARTCEVFQAAGLAVADASIVHDKQFQLIGVTAEKWVPIIEVPVSTMKIYLEKKRREGYSILGLDRLRTARPLTDSPSRKKQIHEDVNFYKESMAAKHDLFLDSLLQRESYTKLYSYTHLLNGFAIHTSEEAIEILRSARGVQAVHEDVKMEKLTTHTSDYLGIPSSVWPSLGGAPHAGEGVVIGMIDTGINPHHPSFSNERGFPRSVCGGKIAAARYFAHGVIANGDFNAARDYASPFDADGHGRQGQLKYMGLTLDFVLSISNTHAAATAAGNYRTPVMVNGFNYGYASDVVAAVDQAVEDGVDILSLSIGPATVPAGPSAFLNVLDIELLFAVKAGVLVIQAVGNGGPSSSSVLSFSPWIVSVAAADTDRKYNNSIELGNGRILPGSGLAPPTSRATHIPIASARDIIRRNSIDMLMKLEDCHGRSEHLRRRRDHAQIGAAGFILTLDTDFSPFVHATAATLSFPVPGILLETNQASSALWSYYNTNTARGRGGRVRRFGATARILDGRRAVYTGHGPVVASYSSRGPDVNNALLQKADVLKPTFMAPGTDIWAAWSPSSGGDPFCVGQDFALLSGTSMAAPHVAGVAALIKQRNPRWTPAMVTSALSTTATATILADRGSSRGPAGPFDYGAGFISPARALDPGLVFDARFEDYVRFLCAGVGVDGNSVRRAVGIGCEDGEEGWSSDLNAPSVTVSNLVGSRRVMRRLTNVGGERETYNVTVREPSGVSVRVAPQVFAVEKGGAEHVRISLTATRAINEFAFGEVMFEGDRGHVVSVPLAIYVTSTMGG